MHTAEEAIENAGRLLAVAEVETDRQLMERFEHLADSWIALARLLAERERV